jgi:hypothetical protein
VKGTFCHARGAGTFLHSAVYTHIYLLHLSVSTVRSFKSRQHLLNFKRTDCTNLTKNCNHDLWFVSGPHISCPTAPLSIIPCHCHIHLHIDSPCATNSKYMLYRAR